MIFLFDVDGVCGDMVGKILLELNNKFDSNIPKYEDILNHDLLDPKKSALTKAQLDFVHKILVKEGFAANLDLIDNCKETVNALRQNDHTVKFLTAPYYWSKTWCYDRLLWLKTHFGIDEADLIFAKDKSLVFGDVFVDDKISNVESWQKRWSSGKGFIFTQPWNASSKLPRITWDGVAKLG